MEKDSRIYIAGHSGLVGSALLRKFKAEGHSNLITRRHAKLDLTRQSDVENFFRKEKPEHVIIAAARVGGIHANNTYPAEFIYDNLVIQTHIIHSAWQSGVKRLLFLGSSCIYPRECLQPMKEEYLLTGPLESTNEPYAMAKIAGIKMCQSYNRQYDTRFLALMPTNLFGPNDSFDFETSHVLPALIRKFHLAALAADGDWDLIEQDESEHGPILPEFLHCLMSISIDAGHHVSVPDRVALPEPAVPVWGTGRPRREFLHVDDLADACYFILNRDEKTYSDLLHRFPTPLINIGMGKDNTILELAKLTSEIVGFKGNVILDHSRPDGTPQKLLDISKITSLGWTPRISLSDGIRNTYRWYVGK